jgi:hypothetical protein
MPFAVGADEFTLCEHNGTGAITHMQFTFADGGASPGP